MCASTWRRISPSAPRADEAYARPATEFLKLRDMPANGHDRRTFVDLTATTVFPNGLASRFHQVVFQPLTESAAAEAREYAFGFEADTESVQLRGARVYRADGKIDEAIETGEGAADNPALSTYTSERAYYVHFPRLNPGDVVELLYRVEDVAPRNAFADYFGEVNYLQSSEPIARAEYVLLTPRSRAFYFNEPHVPNLTRTVEESGDVRTYRFVATDVPPVLPEASQPPYGELLGHVHVSTYKSWDDMARWYWGLVKDQFVADDEVRRRSAEATKGLTDERAKVRAVYDYVVEKTRYVALEFGIHGFKPYSSAQIFARGFGDCKDKATLIVTMLKELGIPATIVIVRTGIRGDFETYPASLAPFDHAIAYVPSLDLYLDGTAEYAGSMELPTMDRGALALQVNEGVPKLVHLPDPPASESVTTRKVDVTEAADGSALIDWRLTVTGAAAGGFRQRYHVASARKERLAEDLGSELAGLAISQVEASNLDDLEQPVSLHVRARSQELARRERDTLSIPAGPRTHLVRNWAPLSERRLDVRLHSRATTVGDWTLHLPPGLRVVSTPLPAEVRTPFGSVSVVTEAAGSTVHAVTTIALDSNPDFRQRVRRLPRLLRGRRSRARSTGHRVQMRLVAWRLGRVALTVALAAAPGACRGASSPSSLSPLTQLRADGPTSAKPDAVGLWALAEMLAPGGDARQATAARARLDAFAAGPRDMYAHLAQAVYDEVHGAPKPAADAYVATLNAARSAGDDPDAALVAWYATHHLLALRGPVTGLFASHKAELEALIASPGSLGWRAAAELVEWSSAEDYDAAESTGDAYDLAATKKLGCMPHLMLAGPFGRGAPPDRRRSFGPEKPGPWPPSWPTEAARGTAPHVLKVEQHRCYGGSTEDVGEGVFYAQAFFTTRDRTDVLVAVQGALALWVDDARVLERDLRQWGIWQRFGAVVRVDPGRHRVLARLMNDGASVRLLTPEGRPADVTSDTDDRLGYSMTPPVVVGNPNPIDALARAAARGGAGEVPWPRALLAAYAAHVEGLNDVADVLVGPLVEPDQAAAVALESPHSSQAAIRLCPPTSSSAPRRTCAPEPWPPTRACGRHAAG